MKEGSQKPKGMESGTPAEQCMEFGSAMQEVGELEGAAAAYQRATLLDPENSIAWRELGHSLLALGDPTRAIKAFSQALEIDGEDFEALEGLMDVRLALGQEELFLEACSQAWAMAERMEERHWSKAIELNRKKAQENPRNPKAWLGLAQAQLRGEADDEASISSLRQGAEACPENPELRLKLASVLAGSGGHREAAEILGRLIEGEEANGGEFGQKMIMAAKEGLLDAQAKIEMEKGLQERRERLLAMLCQGEVESKVWKDLVDELLNLGQREEALSFAEEWRHNHPQDILALTAFLEASAELGESAPPFQAIAQLIELSGGKGGHGFEAAYCLRQINKCFGLLQIGEKALEDDSGNPALYRQVTEALFCAGESLAAAQLAAAMMLRHPEGFDTFLGTAQELARAGQFEAAAGLLERAHEIQPENLWIRRSLSRAYRQLQRYGSAAEILEGAQDAKEGEIPLLKAELAFCYSQNGQDDLAEKTFLEAFSMGEGEAMGHYWYGHHLYRQQRHQEALLQFQHAMELNPKDPRSGADALGSLLSMGRAPQAELLARKLLLLHPDHPGLHLNLATALQAMGRTEEATKALRKAIELEPRSPNAAFAWGMHCLELEKEQDALVAFRRALKLGLSNPSTLKALAYEAKEMGESEMEIAALKQAMPGDSRNPQISLRLYFLLEEKGEQEEARLHLERTERLAEAQPEYAQMLAVAKAQLKALFSTMSN